MVVAGEEARFLIRRRINDLVALVAARALVKMSSFQRERLERPAGTRLHRGAPWVTGIPGPSWPPGGPLTLHDPSRARLPLEP